MLRKVTASSLILGLALALSLVISPAKLARAQQGITWSTGFQVQNLGTGSAIVNIDLINQDGTTAATISNETIATGGSKTYFPVPVTSPFNGSAIVSSTQPVGVILDILGNNGVAGQSFYSEAANGVAASSTSTTVNLPLILRGNSGFNTWFSVQNAGSADASVTVAYKKGSFGTDLTLAPVTIKPGASLTFDQSTEAGLGVKFIGSAKVTSSQPLAVVVNQVGTGSSRTLFTYSGFANGSNSVALPLIQQANATTFTGLSIQNVGTVTANVTVTYSKNTVGATGLTNDAATLAPGASVVFIKNDATRYIGSATVTTGAANQQVVVVVDQLSTVRGQGSAYEGIAASSATTKVSLPLLMNANAGFFTGVQCANAGSAPTTITLTFTTYTRSDNTTLTPSPVSATVSPGLSANFLQNVIGQKYIGGATVTTSPATPVFCIVNQVNDGTISGDAFLTYDGINF